MTQIFDNVTGALSSMVNNLKSTFTSPNLNNNNTMLEGITYNNGRREFANGNMMGPANNKANAVPAQILPNGNILLKNGNIVDAVQIANNTAMSNANANIQKNLSNGNIKLTNSNTIQPNKNAAVANNMPVPISINSDKSVNLSSGDTVAAKNIANMPNYPPNSENIGMNSMSNVSPMSNISANVTSNINAARSGCPIAPPTRAIDYCTPAPFSGAGKYFLVGDAYGHPAA